MSRTLVMPKHQILTAIRLSALMIGKLGMSVQDCINEYASMSQRIFKHGRHRRGKMSKGILLPRYCGKRFGETVEDLFKGKMRDCHEPMFKAQAPHITAHW